MSYVRLVRFALLPGRESVADQVAGELASEIRKQEGCNGVTFFADHESRQYGLFVLWDSVAAADAAAAVIGPRLQEQLKGNVESPPDLRLFEVMRHDA